MQNTENESKIIFYPYDDLILKLNKRQTDISITFVVLPFFFEINENYKESNIFMRHSEDFMVPFIVNWNLKSYKTMISSILEVIDEQTFGVLDLIEEDVISSQFLSFDEFAEDSTNITILVSMYLGKGSEPSFLSVLQKYNDRFRSEILKTNSELFKFNLVYISASRLYELCVGETYTIELEDGRNFYADVDNGIFLPYQISNIYKYRTGDVPVSSFTVNPNAPSESLMYKNTLPFFKDLFLKMCSEGFYFFEEDNDIMQEIDIIEEEEVSDEEENENEKKPTEIIRDEESDEEWEERDFSTY